MRYINSLTYLLTYLLNDQVKGRVTHGSNFVHTQIPTLVDNRR